MPFLTKERIAAFRWLLPLIIICVRLTYMVSQPVIFNKASNFINQATGTIGQAKSGCDINGDGRDDILRVSKDGIYLDFQN